MKKKIFVFLLALLFAVPAYGQNSGTVQNHAFAIGKGPGVSGWTSLTCAATQLAVGQAAADPICRTVTGDWTINAAGVAALATVNVNVGTFGSSTNCLTVTVDGKGRITAASQTACAPTGITALTGDVTAGPGSGSQAATLATVNANVGTFGSATSCVTVTNNAKGLTTAVSAATCAPAIGNVTGLGAGVAGALANVAGTASGIVVFNGALGTPSAGVGTNLTALNASNLSSGTVAAARGGAGAINGVLAGNGAGVVSQGTCAGLSGVAASCGTDATNAANISSGTLPTARLNIPKLFVTLSASQSVTDNVSTLVNLNTVATDSLGAFNTTTHLYTPTVAGWYQVTARVRCSVVTTVTACVADINKNGASYARSSIPGVGANGDAMVTALVSVNGSSDTISVNGITIGTGGSDVFAGGSAPFLSTMTATYVGP